MKTKDTALKMAIEALPELISTAQCEFDSQHKAYEGYPAMYHRYGYLKDIADDGTKVLEACKEALEQPASKNCTPLDEYIAEMEKDPEIKQLLDIAREDVKKWSTQPAQEPVAIVYSMQDGYMGQMVVKDIPHKTKLYTHPALAREWQGLNSNEVELIEMKSYTLQVSVNDYEFCTIAFYEGIEQALKQKNT